MPLTPHPDYEAFNRRIQNLPKGSSSQFDGTLFRFVHPSYSHSREAINGLGALKVSGRWHIKGEYACLYTSMTPETALQEILAANRYKRLPDCRSLPSTLLGIQAKLYHLLDLTNGRLRQRLRLSLDTIQNCDWWTENKFDGKESVTQAFARAVLNSGYEGIIAPSAAHRLGGKNLVAFPSKLLRPNSLKVSHR